ncbi:molybdopterin molybdotransferase MoeA [Stieleria sp. TO1_6]|uniref:molybdopterin molybdotransferase MoeA n=1 Tax=Stieleria tagensis TaxID=2956795 RepID=UPI00209AA28F|nr:molybdopterin molybdotransferase MoeA [Stieleria tagensis]MCO8121734.1 molybdopterin molybdotransferase MoeA [Stieleria tagensis]
MNSAFAFSDPDSALRTLGERLAGVTETESVANSIGRILAQPIVADRDSPAADVSAMDGYAIRLSDLQTAADVPISGESCAGSPPPEMVPGNVVRIFTGAILPAGCEAIVKREDTEEMDTSIRFLDSAIESTVAGSHIRRRGENAVTDDQVLQSALSITPAVAAGLANFGCVSPTVFRRVKVALLTSGNEVVDPAVRELHPWQLRNSNRAAIQAMLEQNPAVELAVVRHAADDRLALLETLSECLNDADAVVMTGGVSKGDYDYVPDTIAQAGGQIVFHGLPIRPGKPILGAATDAGKLLLGLPGNPVSATINAHRFLLPLLNKIAGKRDWLPLPSMVRVDQPPSKPIPLHSMPLVRMTDPGNAQWVSHQGSGDLVALANSDGYVCLPPMTATAGDWPFYRWA